MTLRDILEFRGTWRTYQARVLKRADRYLMDGKIHIVAAPGSGKTTLGIELMHRIAKPALVLAPSITIREQWVSRIEEAFLREGYHGEDYFSQDIRNPKLITVATYQALHSAMTRFAGQLDDEEEEDGDSGHTEVVDYSDFDLVATMQAAGISVLCLDECHHLGANGGRHWRIFARSWVTLRLLHLLQHPLMIPARLCGIAIWLCAER